MGDVALIIPVINESAPCGGGREDRASRTSSGGEASVCYPSGGIRDPVRRCRRERSSAEFAGAVAAP
jgi:hypothetical protein